jgi:hypothetical protein
VSTDAMTRAGARIRKGLKAKMSREEMEREPETCTLAESHSGGRGRGEDVQQPCVGEPFSDVRPALSPSALGLRARGNGLAGAALATNGVASRFGPRAGDAGRSRARRLGSERH